MDFQKSVSTRTATLIRAVDLSQKVAPPPPDNGPKLPANRGANAAGRMGGGGVLLGDNTTMNSGGGGGSSSRSIRGASGNGGSSSTLDTPYVTMTDATTTTTTTQSKSASSLATTAARAAAAVSSQQPSKNIQIFQADHVPIGNTANARLVNMQSRLPRTARTTTGGGATGVSPEHQQQLEDMTFLSELMYFAQNRNWKKKVLSLFIMISSFIVLLDLIFSHHVRDVIEAFLNWMTANPFMAVLTFLVFFIISTLLFVPPIILFFGAGFGFCNVCGFMYGIIIATLVSCIGSTIGAVLAFLRSRYVMRELVQIFAKRYPIVKAADRAFARNGFHVMLLLRLCPIVPFNGLNYIGGVTDIELDQFVYALVGIVPTVIFWVLVGGSADKLASTNADDVGEQVFLVALLSGGVLFALTALVLLFRYAKEELRKEIASDRAENWHAYRKQSSTTTDTTTSSDELQVMENGVKINNSDDELKLREEGFEMLAQYPTDVLSVLGIKEAAVENDRVPDDLHDEEWFWVWT